jgi:hypothetical protein
MPTLEFGLEKVIRRGHNGQHERGTGKRAPKEERNWKDEHRLLHTCSASTFSSGPTTFDVEEKEVLVVM